MKICTALVRLNPFQKDMKQKYRVIYGIFKRYADKGIIKPDIRTPLFRLGKINMLSPYYKQILKFYEESSIAKGLKPGTYRSAISACSGLLLHFQNAGHKTLDTVLETDVLKYFCDSHGELRLSSSTKVNIASVFSADLGKFTDSAHRILAYLPKLKKRRKNKPYLTSEEIGAIKNVLLNSSDSLSLRDRAIGTLLYFNGLRAGDIAALRFSNIDWKNELIRITQKKTEIPLTLPLNIPVGNAIYEYISIERPTSNLPQIFLSAAFPFGRMAAGTVCHAAGNIYLAAGIRQNQGSRKGTHLFRHHLATSFISSGISRPIISATLGHAYPEFILNRLLEIGKLGRLERHMHSLIRLIACIIRAHVREECFSWKMRILNSTFKKNFSEKNSEKFLTKATKSSIIRL